LQRLRNASALDDKIVKFFLFGKFGHFLKQVLSKSAADASILEAYEFFLGLDHFRILKEHGIDVKLSHIIDNNSTLQVPLVFENMVKQSGFSSSKESREKSYREFVEI
jgi:hypothetical protein